MSKAFSDLSTEGRLAKLEQHLSGGHPVPSQWVSWIVDQFVPGDVWPSEPNAVTAAFANLDESQKIEKIAYHLREKDIPASWVKWLSEKFVAAEPSLACEAPRR